MRDLALEITVDAGRRGRNDAVCLLPKCILALNAFCGSFIGFLIRLLESLDTFLDAADLGVQLRLSARSIFGCFGRIIRCFREAFVCVRYGLNFFIRRTERIVVFLNRFFQVCNVRRGLNPRNVGVCDLIVDGVDFVTKEVFGITENAGFFVIGISLFLRFGVKRILLGKRVIIGLSSFMRGFLCIRQLCPALCPLDFNIGILRIDLGKLVLVCLCAGIFYPCVRICFERSRAAVDGVVFKVNIAG